MRWLGVKIGRHLASSLHSSNEPDELSQWLHSHDDTSPATFPPVSMIYDIVRSATVRRDQKYDLITTYVRRLRIVTRGTIHAAFSYR